jgi:alcohol dehydrogenase class IV
VIQNFCKKLGFGNKGYSVIDFKKNAKTILVSGHKSNYKYLIKKIEKLSKSKIIHYKIDDKRNSQKFIKLFAKKIKTNKPQNILVLGGGSIIDFAKRVYLLQHNSTNFFIFPSLLGSGAESSITSIITNSGKKDFFIDKNFIPDGVIYDENLINSCKSTVVIKGVIDALTHCVESTLTINTNYYLNFLSYETVNYFIKRHSPNYFKKNINDYYNISLLSFNGGLAQSNSGSAICHALSHAAESIVKENHSKCIAYFIIPTLKYLRKKNKKEMKNFSNQLDKYISDVVKIVKKNENFNKLEKLVFDRKKLDDLLRLAQHDPCWKLYKKSIDIKLLKKILTDATN